jgi:hypothetical protein
MTFYGFVKIEGLRNSADSDFRVIGDFVPAKTERLAILGNSKNNRQYKYKILNIMRFMGR